MSPPETPRLAGIHEAILDGLPRTLRDVVAAIAPAADVPFGDVEALVGGRDRLRALLSYLNAYGWVVPAAAGEPAGLWHEHPSLREAVLSNHGDTTLPLYSGTQFRRAESVGWVRACRPVWCIDRDGTVFVVRSTGVSPPRTSALLVDILIARRYTEFLPHGGAP